MCSSSLKPTVSTALCDVSEKHDRSRTRGAARAPAGGWWLWLVCGVWGAGRAGEGRGRSATVYINIVKAYKSQHSTECTGLWTTHVLRREAISWRERGLGRESLALVGRGAHARTRTFQCHLIALQLAEATQQRVVVLERGHRA